MPSYLSYKNNLKTVLDANDDNIEAWITVKGNHIPIMKGQSKEEAVKSFLEKKQGESGGKKQTFYKNVSGKQIFNKPGISSAKKGYTVVENQLLTEKEMKKHGFDPNSKGFEKVELGKNEHRYEMGARRDVRKKDEPTKADKKNDINRLASKIYSKLADNVGYVDGKELEKYLDDNEFFNDDVRQQIEKKVREIEEGIDANRLDKDAPKPTGRYIDEAGSQTKLRMSVPSLKGNEKFYDDVLADYSKNYKRLYDDPKEDPLDNKLAEEFDELLKTSSEFKEFVGNCVKKRGDIFSSDREAKAMMMTAKQYGFVPQSKSSVSESVAGGSDDETGFQLLEIAYNDVEFGNNAQQNRDSILSAISESGLSTKEADSMRSLVGSMPDSALKNVDAFRSHLQKSQPASIEETEEAIENWSSEAYEKHQANSISKEYNLLKKQVKNIEKVLKENRMQQSAVPAGWATYSKLGELRKEEDRLIKQLRDAQQELDDFVHYEMD